MQGYIMRLAFPFLLLTSLSLLAQDLPRLQEPWQSGYSKEDSTGAHVLGHWTFDGESALKDASGKGNALTLQGAVFIEKGKSGGSLESFPGFPVEDKPHAARTAAKPKLSPKGAFTIEMWIKLKPDTDPRLRPYLLDKKYVDHTDYQWQLTEPSKTGQRRMSVNLGFGNESRLFHSDPLTIEPGIWHHVAFTYDAAGQVRFYFDGSTAGGLKQSGLGPITPGVKALSIGDRLGSNHGGFPGFIDEVRICDGIMNFEPVVMQIKASRHVWRRMETARPIEVKVTNLQRSTMEGAKLRLSLANQEQAFDVPALKSGKSYTATATLNPSLKTDHYPLRARLELNGTTTTQTENFQIVPRPLPFSMPVIMWGSSPDDTAQLKDIGFTHCLGLRADVGSVWEAKKPVPPGKPELIESNRRMLDQALADGINVVASLSPANMFEHDDKMARVDRSGKPYTRRDISASMPELPPFFENVGRSVAQTYGDMPALSAALIDTEVRDASQPSFNAVDVENYRKFANADIPAEVVTRGGVDYTKLKDFPQDRVIADDHPILKYYRWFWTTGDGWNALHSALSRGVKGGSNRLWTWFDPAVRQPSISGAGGSVDVLSHWTYTYPDPQRIGLCADQLFAMSAASGRNQKVMKMTQLIWYRSQTAPIGQKAPGDVVAWQDHDPDAAYITIAPMHLREALWTKIARPIQGIMYHGWQSLVDDPNSTSGYRFTNPNTAPVLKQLIHEVIQPLGPTLVQIPDERSEVAFFESFTSQMFARRGGYGSNMSWATDVWLALQHAHVQCDVLFEETLLKSGLSGRRFLVMPECDVLTKSVVDKIAAWQKKGGKIIADEFLCPGLKADLVLPSFKRVKKADADKAKVIELAQSMSPQLTSIGLIPKIVCDNPEIILRTRRYGDAIYVFAINDKREYGNYVGQHGLVMENGAPASGTITLITDAANIYDLNRSSLVLPTLGEGKASWKVELGPCDGRLFMVVPRPVMQLKAAVPEIAKAGNAITVALEVTDTKSAPVSAVIPMQVQVRDANGKTAEGSGYYGAKDGKLTVKLDIATNDDPGTWQIDIRELASRMEVTKFVRVEK